MASFMDKLNEMAEVLQKETKKMLDRTDID